MGDVQLIHLVILFLIFMTLIATIMNMRASCRKVNRMNELIDLDKVICKELADIRENVHYLDRRLIELERESDK